LLQLRLLVLSVALWVLQAPLHRFFPGTSGVMTVRDLFLVVTLLGFGLRCNCQIVVLLLVVYIILYVGQRFIMVAWS
jgi:hypothetical protein